MQCCRLLIGCSVPLLGVCWGCSRVWCITCASKLYVHDNGDDDDNGCACVSQHMLMCITARFGITHMHCCSCHLHHTYHHQTPLHNPSTLPPHTTQGHCLYWSMCTPHQGAPPTLASLLILPQGLPALSFAPRVVGGPDPASLLSHWEVGPGVVSQQGGPGVVEVTAAILMPVDAAVKVCVVYCGLFL